MPIDMPIPSTTTFQITQAFRIMNEKAVRLFRDIYLYENKDNIQSILDKELHYGSNLISIDDAFIELDFSLDGVLLSKSFNQIVRDTDNDLSDLKTSISNIMCFKQIHSISDKLNLNHNSVESTWFDAGAFSYIRIARNNPPIVYVTCGSFDSEYVKSKQHRVWPLSKERF